MKIGIDKGHNLAVNRGASGIEQEDDLTAELGSLVITELRGRGHVAVDCTPASANSRRNSLKKRVSAANAANVDRFISIHFNASDGNGKGTEVLYFPTSNPSHQIALKVLPPLVALGFKDRGVKKRDDLYVLRHTHMPAVLIEVCFCDSISDMTMYRSIGATDIAKSIVDGILSD